MATFSIIELYNTYFKDGGREIVIPDISGEVAGSRTEIGLYGSNYYATGTNGREYYLPVTVSYIDELGDEVVFNLPYPIVSFTRQKKIIATDMTERNSQVMELINNGSWNITIRGFCINTVNELPESDVQKLMALEGQKQSVKIRSVLTDLILNNTGYLAVVNSMNVMEVRGSKMMRPYELSLISNQEFNLLDIK